MGQAPAGESYNHRGEGLPLIAGAGDFRDDRIVPSKFTTKPSKVSWAGDIVLSIRASIGAKVLADGEYCLGRGVASLRPGPKLDRAYLWHWLSHSERALAAKGRGATFLQVNRNDIGEMPIGLPPLDEQRRIAAILDQADALRAKRRQVLTHLDDLGPGIFRHMFGHPVTNDRNWPLKRLADLGTLDRGVSKHRPRNDPALLGGAHPLIQTGDVANSGGYISKFHATYSDLGIAQSRMWPAGTLCITIAANIAKTGILTFDACFPDSVVGFTSSRESTTFVQAWLGFLQATLEASAPQSAQKNINLAILRELKVPVPSGDRVKEFHERICAVKEHRASTNRGQAALDAMFTSLQSHAFRGEL